MENIANSQHKIDATRKRDRVDHKRDEEDWQGPKRVTVPDEFIPA